MGHPHVSSVAMPKLHAAVPLQCLETKAGRGCIYRIRFERHQRECNSAITLVAVAHKLLPL